jgi:ABC-type branched-subunit amino acid transport system permease subunit
MSARPRAAFVPLPMLLLLVGLASAPLWLTRVGLYQYLALEIMIWMLFALGYNLLLGYGGLPSFGHGAFFGIGAYAFGLLQLRLWPNLWFDLIGAAVIAAAFGAVVAAFISHRRGIYYALLTIAFGQVFWFVAIKWHSVTGGEDGLLNIKRLRADFGFASFDLASNQALYYFAFGIFTLVVFALWRLVHSPFGRILTAIKQNEMRAAFVGHDVWLYKWIAFTLSAAGGGSRRRAVRDGAAVGLSKRDEPAFVRVRRDDGLDRRRTGELLGAGARRVVFHPRSRPAGRVYGDLAALVRLAVHGHGAVAAGGNRRRVASMASCAPAGGARTRRQQGGLKPCRCSKRKHLHKRFGDAVVSRTFRFRSTRAGCPASWGRMARARRRASTC